MAVRLHVVGARGVAREAFASAFAGLGAAHVRCANGWTWFEASVWSVEAEHLDRGCDALRAPCVRVTSEDACRWYLHVRWPGAAPELFCHPFTYAARTPGCAAEHEPVPSKAKRAQWLRAICPATTHPARPADRSHEAVARVEKLRREMSRVGRFLLEQNVFFKSPAPRDVAERLLGLAYEQAMREYFLWQANAMSDCLARAGIPHDRERVVSTLTGASVSNGESESDLGNMPRFLADIGFGREFEEWVEKASGGPESEYKT